MKEIFNGLPYALFVTDQYGKITFVNKNLLEACGLDQKVLLGRSCRDLIAMYPLLPDNFECPAIEVLQHGRVVRRKYEFEASGGWNKVVDVEAAPVKAEGGSVLGMTVAIRDITENAKLEELLARYAEGLTVLYELSSVFLTARGLKSAITQALKMINEFYGADLALVAVPTASGKGYECIAGTGWGSEDIGTTVYPLERSDITAFGFTDKSPAIVNKFNKDGRFKRTRLYEAHDVKSGISVPMITEERVLGVLSILYKRQRAIDTAELWYLNVVANTLAVYIEKERSLEKREESEAFLTSVLEGIGEGVIVVDRDMRILSANRHYLKTVKKPLEAVRGTHCYENHHRSAVPCYERGEICTVKAVFDTGRPQSAMHVHLEIDNNPAYVQTSAYPIFDSTGQVAAVVETMADITEKCKLEKDLEKRVKELEEFYEMAVGRELKMMELKEEISRLKADTAKHKHQ